MAKIIPSLIQQSQSVAAAEKVRIPAVAAMKRVSDSSNLTAEPRAESTQIFWMRDPKTGNWIPENHFDDVDVAEQREKLLSKK
ncbi:uncharacterized protein LOC131252183 [Magnolia sinica]|uniref:uncharacterized protein LOC131252183 n=1 Tax=Magnolia sinica TaxID=86752 RepID=UPI0026588015|nr:uncharacterized protein LOC131252183 [Magnolia sinica]